MGENDVVFIFYTLKFHFHRCFQQRRKNLFGVTDEKIHLPRMNGSGDQTAEKDHVVSPFDDHFRGKEIVPRSVDELTNKQIIRHCFRFPFAVAQIRRVERIPTFRLTDQFGKLSLFIFSRQTNVSNA